MKICLAGCLFLMCLLVPVCVFAGDLGDYLILQDIGSYKLPKPEKIIPGFLPFGDPRTYDGAAIVSGADHFPDHTDTTYEVMYFGGAGNASPTVSVTQHAGSEADKWLLHELEDPFRDDDDLNESLDAPDPVKVVDNNTILSVWGYYRWISNNLTVSVEFMDITGTKPEPLEVVRAYLAKYPSTIPSSLKLDRQHTIAWLNDEMNRRLWLADKWAGLIQPEDSELSDKLENMADSMEAFLLYRAKYFAVEAKAEIEAIRGFVELNNETALRAKLAEYLKWWAAHKSGSIKLL